MYSNNWDLNHLESNVLLLCSLIFFHDSISPWFWLSNLIGFITILKLENSLMICLLNWVSLNPNNNPILNYNPTMIIAIESTPPILLTQPTTITVVELWIQSRWFLFVNRLIKRAKLLWLLAQWSNNSNFLHAFAILSKI